MEKPEKYESVFTESNLKEGNADLSLIYVVNSLTALYHDYSRKNDLKNQNKILRKIKSILSDVVDLDDYLSDEMKRSSLFR